MQYLRLRDARAQGTSAGRITNPRTALRRATGWEQDFFRELGSAGECGPVTALRALDIVVWPAGKQLAAARDEPDDESE